MLIPTPIRSKPQIKSKQFTVPHTTLLTINLPIIVTALNLYHTQGAEVTGQLRVNG